MHDRGRWLPALIAAVTGIAGCGGGDETGGASPRKPVKHPTVIDIVVDANRNGELDDDDEPIKNEWTVEHGASFLANLDDDDGDGVRDAEDEIINGDADYNDLAYIAVKPWPTAPKGATGYFTIDDASAANTRLWKQGMDGAWSLVAGSIGPCNSDTAA